MKKYLEYLKGETIYSPAVISIAGIWSVWTHILAASPDIHGNIYLRIVIAAVSISPTIGILFIYRRATKNKSRNLIALIPVILIASASRGFILAVLFTKFGITSKYNFAFRIPNAIVLISFALIVSTILVAGFREQRESMQELRREKNHLIASLHELNGRYRSQDVRLRENISEFLFLEISKIDARSAKTAIESIRHLIEDLVRPMSHSIAQQIPKFDIEDIQTKEDRLSVKQVLQSITPEVGINIKILSMVMALQILPFGIVYGTLTILKIVLAILLTFPFALKIAQIVLIRFSHTLNLGSRIFLLVTILGLAPLPTCGIIYYIIQKTSDPYYFFKAGPSFTILAAGLITMASAILSASNNVKREIRETNDELAWNIARINLIVWNLQGVVARNLHGTVQSNLHASIFELNEMMKNNSDSKESVLIVQTKIIRSMKDAFSDDRKYIPLEDIFNQIRDSWRDVCTVQFNHNLKSMSILERDQPAKNTLIEIIRESISNAVRHAKSDYVDVHIESFNNTITINVKNNGKSFQTHSTKSQGFNFLNSVAVSYQILTEEDKTLLKVKIPVLI